MEHCRLKACVDSKLQMGWFFFRSVGALASFHTLYILSGSYPKYRGFRDAALAAFGINLRLGRHAV